MAQNRSPLKPTPEQIHAQTDRILSSKLFSLSKRMKAFLSYIVDAELEGQGEKLKEFALAVEVFNKDESFDPAIDSIVRVEASRLRSKLREYYLDEGKIDPVLIEIPKGHYVPVFSLVGLDSAMTNLNQKQTIGGTASITDDSSRRRNFLVIALIAVAISVFLVINHEFSDAQGVPAEIALEKTVAVLPFVPLSSGEDDGYFADGLTEEILNSLAQLPELEVSARTSSFFFKGQNLLVPEIASRLGVAHVVEGSVRREGDRLRIAAQLIRASDNFHMWSRIYDRKHGDVFEVQEDIAENIAEVLGVVLDDTARDVMRSAGIRNVEAFIAYQKGQEAWVAAHQGVTMSNALMAADRHFNVALQVAPGLAMVRLMKADRRGHIIFEIVSGIRDESFPNELRETVAASREEYDLAVKLSKGGNQRDILDLEGALFSENWTGLAFQIEKAMRPGGCPQMNWTSLVAYFGWADQVVTKLREAIKCNPLDTYASYQLAWSLIWSGDANAALQAIADADNKGIYHPSLNDARYWALLASGRVDERGVPGPGTQASRLSYDREILREALSGDVAVARQLANNYWSTSDSDDLSSMVIAAVIGDRERANEFVARIDAHPGSAVVISHAVFSCFCGAPFDLNAAPNYMARIEEAGFPWPPPKRIDYPAKNW